MSAVLSGAANYISTNTWFNPVNAFCRSAGPGFTVSCWVRVTGGSGFPGILTTTQGGSAANCFYIIYDVGGSNNLHVAYYDGAALDTFDATGILLTSNVWWHLTVHYTGNLSTTNGAAYTWVNGRLARTSSFATGTVIGTTNATNAFEIGRGDGSDILAGHIAQVRLFVGRLAQGDIITNMRSALCPSALRGRCLLDAPLNGYAGSSTSRLMLGTAGVRSPAPTAPLTQLPTFAAAIAGFAPDPPGQAYPALQITEEPWLVAGTGVAAGPNYVAQIGAGVNAAAIAGETFAGWNSGKRTIRVKGL